MKFGILSRGELLYSTQSLVNAGKAKQHEMLVIDPQYCNLLIEDKYSLVQYHDYLLNDLDAIIPRVGASNTYRGASIIRHFEAMNVFSIATSQGIVNSRDKWVSFQLLAAAGIPTPKTTLGAQHYLEAFLSDFGKGPVIIKMIEGTSRHIH